MNKKTHCSRRRSSFDLIDPEKLFAALPIAKDSVVLDAICGSGTYTLAMAPLCPNGKIFAFDLWEAGIDELIDKIITYTLVHVVPRVADICSLPLGTGTIDICLMATVFHNLVQEGTDRDALLEIRRVLKPNGLLAAIEFKKIPGPPGPPLGIRISPADLDETLRFYGFTPARDREIDLGAYNYLSIYHKNNRQP
ncbi:MAG: class I SAM-dependent methyltransferase [Desulfocapsaceae bacterium]|nr:class I SAM-dependent methyltransferase [Desulfocapsaceae bacterium]